MACMLIALLGLVFGPFCTTTAAAPVRYVPPLVIGDSISLLTAPYLQGVRVDGVVGRQFITGVGIAYQDGRNGILPGTVVVELGTNGPPTDWLFNQMMQNLNYKSQRRVAFVTPFTEPWTYSGRVWIRESNDVIWRGAHRWRAGIIPWHNAAQAHPGWMGPDGIHPNSMGAYQLAQMIQRSIGNG